MAKQRKAVESCGKGFEAFEGFKGHAENVPDSSFEAQQRQRKAVESCWEGFEGVEGFKGC